jgi:hypothetical protein
MPLLLFFKFTPLFMNSVENQWFWHLKLNYACGALKWNYSTIELAASVL